MLHDPPVVQTPIVARRIERNDESIVVQSLVSRVNELRELWCRLLFLKFLNESILAILHLALTRMNRVRGDRILETGVMPLASVPRWIGGHVRPP